MEKSTIVNENQNEVSTPTKTETGDLLLVNASGHEQQLDRNFGVWSICFESFVTDNAWCAGSASLVVAFYNGGAPGILYEFLVVSCFCLCIGAALAELSSSIPSSSSVYHWASVTAGPKYGRFCSWLAGWWNCLAYIFGCASISLSSANAIVAIYALYNPDYQSERWQVFIAFLGIAWISCSVVLFGQRILPWLFNACGVLSISCWVIILLVCAIMPSTTGNGHATNAFVWTEWQNLSGYSSDGFVFLAGMLNGGYALGTIDGVTHLAEEVPQPKKNIPRGIFAMLIGGIFTTFTFYVAMLYAITDVEAVLASPIPELPIAAVFLQATGSKAGTTALLVLFALNLLMTLPGAYVTSGRMLWTLARDKAAPFSDSLSQVSPRFRNPFLATFICGICVTILGCIFIGSATAFTAFIGSFIILITLSYLAAVLPHLLTGRKYIVPGPFYMKGALGYIIIGIACAYMIVFDVIYLFPYYLPVDADTMNYSVVMSGGLTILIALGYVWKRSRGYVGPHVVMNANDEITKAVILPDRRGSVRNTSV